MIGDIKLKYYTLCLFQCSQCTKFYRCESGTSCASTLDKFHSICKRGLEGDPWVLLQRTGPRFKLQAIFAELYFFFN